MTNDRPIPSASHPLPGVSSGVSVVFPAHRASVGIARHARGMSVAGWMLATLLVAAMAATTTPAALAGDEPPPPPLVPYGDLQQPKRLAALVGQTVDIVVPAPAAADARAVPGGLVRKYRSQYTAQLAPGFFVVADERRFRRAIQAVEEGRLARYRGEIKVYPGDRDASGRRQDAYYLDFAAIESAVDLTAARDPVTEEPPRQTVNAWVAAKMPNGPLHVVSRFPGLAPQLPEPLVQALGLNPEAWRTLSPSPFWPSNTLVLVPTEHVAADVDQWTPWNTGMALTGRVVPLVGLEGIRLRKLFFVSRMAASPEDAWRIPAEDATSAYQVIDPLQTPLHDPLDGQRISFLMPWRGWRKELPEPVKKLAPVVNAPADRPRLLETRGTDWANNKVVMALASVDAPGRAALDTLPPGDTVRVLARVDKAVNGPFAVMVEQVTPLGGDLP